MDKLRYRNLTPKAIEMICNGCTVKGGFFKVPNFLFDASCNQHDFYYWRGYTDECRKKADKMFYEAMLEDAKKPEYGFFESNFYKLWAWSYYIAVRLKGKKYFHFGDKMKGQEELNKELETFKVPTTYI